jgi:hypothetical protein
MAWRRSVSASLAVTLGSMAAVSCGGASEPGDLVLRIHLPSGETIGLVSYEVVSSKGTALAFGSIDATSSDDLPPFHVAVPGGVDHRAHASGTSASGKRCAGDSDPFYVRGSWTSVVDLTVTCGVASTVVPPGLRDVRTKISVEIQTRVCPQLASWTGSPLQTSAPAGTIDLGAAGTDAEHGHLLSYQWTATAGTFKDAAGAHAAYVCSTAGQNTLMVTVSDNHPQLPCSAAVTIPVECKSSKP